MASSFQRVGLTPHLPRHGSCHQLPWAMLGLMCSGELKGPKRVKKGKSGLEGQSATGVLASARLGHRKHTCQGLPLPTIGRYKQNVVIDNCRLTVCPGSLVTSSPSGRRKSNHVDHSHPAEGQWPRCFPVCKRLGYE